MSFVTTTVPERAEIFACDSAETLNAWHRELYDLFDDVQSRIEAYQLAGTAAEDWLRRAAGKIAVTKRGIRNIERRLVELGHDLPPTRSGKEGEMIRALRSRVSELERLVERLGAGAAK